MYLMSNSEQGAPCACPPFNLEQSVCSRGEPEDVCACEREQRGKGKAILVVSRSIWSFPAFMKVAPLGPSSALIGGSWLSVHRLLT